jgi:hypothetical protein
MPTELNLAQLLRPIGAALEPLQIESFTLRVENEEIFIRAQKREERHPVPVSSAVPSVWDIFHRKKINASPAPQPASRVVELRYSYDDIARMDSQGVAKRVATGGKPDPGALSQMLRAVGAFVNQKQGRLLGVTMEGHDIAIDYESALKQKTTEKHTIASLYDYWVKMYLRRRERS